MARGEFWSRRNCAAMPVLEKEVWLVGQGSHFEIWSDAGWKAQQEAIYSLGDKLLPPGMEHLSL
jgi:MraZ protein